MDKMTSEELQAFAKQHGLPDSTTDIFSYVQGWLRGYRRAATLYTLATPQVWANNGGPLHRPLVPDSEVQRFYRERIVAAPETSSLTSTELYEEYCVWCEENDKEPFAHPRVTRELGELGVKKDRVGKRTRYVGIALRSADNKAVTKPLVPDTDVQCFYRERIIAGPEGSSLTSTELYEEYCAWCEEHNKEPFFYPRVAREIGELGVKKERIGKRTRYFGIALKSVP